MPRLSRDQWQEARIAWEADPKATFESIGVGYGTSRVAVSKQAAKNDWQKVRPLASINEAAHLRADARTVEKNKPNASGEVTPKLSPDPEVAPRNSKMATVQQAVNVRADIVERHRADWDEHRRHFELGTIAEDFEQGKKAKISAEMLLLRQKGERAAYGLDDLAQRPPVADEKAVVIDVTAARDVAFALQLGLRNQALKAGLD
jgi:hypothetical protein